MSNIETWKPSPVFPDKFEVSNTGVVRNKITGHIMKPQTDKKGYRRLRLTHGSNKQSARVHRLVAIAFIENPNRLPQVNHIDGDKGNNAVSNLEWSSNFDNMTHAVHTGLTNHVAEAGRPRRAVIGCKNGIEFRFDSIAEAEEQTKTQRGNIVAACKGRRPWANGYRWKYESEVMPNEQKH